jgi:type III secretion protein J
VALIAAGFGLTTACAVPVAVDLDEASANRVARTLDENGIAVEKSEESSGGDRWRIEVSRDDAAHAVSVLADRGLPEDANTGAPTSSGVSALVPSRGAEQARLLAGTAAELERTLSAIDGVLTARVHLAVEHVDPLSDAEPPKPTASVLLRYRGTSPPISENDVRKLVGGAVTGLSPDRIAVVSMVAPDPPATEPLVVLGPFSTTRSGAAKLRALLAGAAVLNVFLVLCVLSFWARARKLRQKPAALPARDPR